MVGFAFTHRIDENYMMGFVFTPASFTNPDFLQSFLFVFSLGLFQIKKI